MRETNREICHADAELATGGTITKAGSLLHGCTTVSHETHHARSMKLHEEIFKALPDDFVRRMWNWVRSRDGGSVATSRFDERVDNTRDEHPIPTLLGEADDTHRAILTLPQRYQEVITIFWTRNHMTLAGMACSTPRTRLWKIGKASFRMWLDTGHGRLQGAIEEQTTACRERHTLT